MSRWCGCISSFRYKYMLTVLPPYCYPLSRIHPPRRRANHHQNIQRENDQHCALYVHMKMGIDRRHAAPITHYHRPQRTSYVPSYTRWKWLHDIPLPYWVVVSPYLLYLPYSKEVSGCSYAISSLSAWSSEYHVPMCNHHRHHHRHNPLSKNGPNFCRSRYLSPSIEMTVGRL